MVLNTLLKRAGIGVKGRSVEYLAHAYYLLVILLLLILLLLLLLLLLPQGVVGSAMYHQCCFWLFHLLSCLYEMDQSSHYHDHTSNKLSNIRDSFSGRNSLF